MDKASMLDEAIEYLKQLQLQVQVSFLSDSMLFLVYVYIYMYIEPTRHEVFYFANVDAQ